MEKLPKPSVTKEWLQKKLMDEQQRDKVIGRALLSIYKNQTLQEQNTTCTTNKNGIGFCKPDARIGSIGARMYKAHAKLDSWVIDIWMRPAKDGYPRICKYADQLNTIAHEKWLSIIRNDNSKCKNFYPNVVML